MFARRLWGGPKGCAVTDSQEDSRKGLIKRLKSDIGNSPGCEIPIHLHYQIYRGMCGDSRWVTDVSQPKQSKSRTNCFALLATTKPKDISSLPQR